MAIENPARRIFALQYHPEVRHSLRGAEVLKRFLFDIAAINPDWKIENVLEEELEKLRKLVRFSNSEFSELLLQGVHGLYKTASLRTF